MNIGIHLKVKTIAIDNLHIVSLERADVVIMDEHRVYLSVSNDVSQEDWLCLLVFDRLWFTFSANVY